MFQAKSELALFHLTTIEDFAELGYEDFSGGSESSNDDSNSQNISAAMSIFSPSPIKRLSRCHIPRHNQRSTSKLLKEALIFINC